ncbi:hypothetical protein CDD80_4605 [Ophiocordyceps camponoti-rufipedis]|uniref:Uncharacterized protein n=1 Tax=Ophiocordyceps camponoti-rufipedis TaxID=2004952 RepID=A0A2C5YS14_9HYPO|nr:hypothetical protein CDD80_4605 [Ophiocordyceps camponoti-rufipedis]
MDEARLVEALRRKLHHLEGILEACRRHLLADFEQHYRSLLRDVAPDRAAQVRRAIAAGFANYPALRPELAAAESPPPEGPSPAAAFQQPPAVSGTTRERELELQGLFTPTYLPLLESSPAVSVLSSLIAVSTSAVSASSASSASSPPPSGAQEGMEDPRVQPMPACLPTPSRPFVLSIDHGTPTAAAAAPSAVTTAADDATSSASSTSSEKSDSKHPRSALRRSPTMVKTPQSPRRVRFEFMGAEVLPTTSPQPSELITRRPPSPRADGDRGDDELDQDEEREEGDENADDDDDAAAFVSNLCGDTTEEEATIPRKVSSSDALRALSRTPIEEGVVWTVVNAESDDPATNQEGQDATSPPPTSPERDSPPVSQTIAPPPKTIIALEPNDDGESDSDADSDAGFLAMAGAKSRRSGPLLPPAVSAEKPLPDSRSTKQPSSAQVVEEQSPALASDDVEVDDEDDDLFPFETAGLSLPSKWTRRSSWREEKAPETDPVDDESDATREQTDMQFGVYATSPAVPIRQSRNSRTSDSAVKFRPGSVGSYKGQPLMMPVVRDPKLLERALSDESQIVRETDLDDRTAMEEGSPPRFPNTPFSFKERFIMEEMMERRKSNRDDIKEEGR